jgi:homoserine kinase
VSRSAAIAHEPVAVEVPATSANLGPGFDTLGLALTLYDRVRMQATQSGLEVEVEGAGAATVPRDETHLVARAARAAFDAMGVAQPGLSLSCCNAVPHGRGLGSSAAAIVAGIVAARALVEGGSELLDDPSALRLAAAVEGHPDNVAAALLGGLTIAWEDDVERDGARASRLDVSGDVTVFVPGVEVSTQVARGLLPAQVPHAHAARNAGRAALLVAALTGRPELMLPATRDWLHQSYRASVMPESSALVDQLRADGVAAVVSGAGPSVLAFRTSGCDLNAYTPAGWHAIDLAVSAHGARVLS